VVGFRERVATHEAGHCVAALAYGIPILSVTIDNAPNMHRGAYKAAHACGLECLTVLCLAGIAAEEMFCGPITDGGDQPDLRMAREHVARAIANPLHAAAELARWDLLHALCAFGMGRNTHRKVSRGFAGAV
jgi:hypothetical protein